MNRLSRPCLLLMVAVIYMTACAPRPERGTGAAAGRAGPVASPSRLLTIPFAYEVTHLLPKVRSAGSPGLTMRVFNAALTLNDDAGAVRPYLAEALPRLNTDTWRLFPDGRMETTYRLRPGLTWQDGQPLEAEDFVFAHRVYTNSSLSSHFYRRLDLMESAVAVDARTLVIRWRAPYPDAGNIQDGEFDPLPRHILDQPFAALEENPAGADAFLALPHWKPEYVGAGPYRLVQWEPASYFEGVAFEGHALGRPKIDRIVIRHVADDNVRLTNILAGTLDWAELPYEQGLLLERGWAAAGNGVVIFPMGHARAMWIQQRPEYVAHPALLDVRVRGALAHSLDRQAVNDGVFEGQGLMTETVAVVTEPFYPEVDRAIMHYPYDPRRTEQLMTEVGFTKDRDGFFANTAGERVGFDLQRINGSEFERIQLILVDAWRRVGFEVHPTGLPAAQIGAGEQRHTYRGITQKGGMWPEVNFTTPQIGTAENRWTGENRGGWSNAEYDQLYERFSKTLDRVERTGQFVQMQRLISEQLPVFFTHYATSAIVRVAALRGPMAGSAGTGTFTPGTLTNWNLHEWEWQ